MRARHIHSYSDRRLSAAPLLLLSALAGANIVPSSAQTATAPTQDAAAAPADIIKQREQELEAARTEQKNAADSQAKLKADIAAIGQDRTKLNQQLIDIASQVRGVEDSISDREARLRTLGDREQQIRSSLDSRRSEVVEVLAALQRAGRRTPQAR